VSVEIRAGVKNCDSASGRGWNTSRLEVPTRPSPLMSVRRRFWNAARARLSNAADRLAQELLRMATDDNVSDSVKLAAIRDALDRGGLSVKQEVELTARSYEQIFEGMSVETGSRIQAAVLSYALGDQARGRARWAIRRLPMLDAEDRAWSANLINCFASPPETIDSDRTP
jgi:hypothetical protein